MILIKLLTFHKVLFLILSTRLIVKCWEPLMADIFRSKCKMLPFWYYPDDCRKLMYNRSLINHDDPIEYLNLRKFLINR